MHHLLLPFVRSLPPETAHALGLGLLKLPWRYGRTVDDPFEWKGLSFRNRIGIAAGFDKNAVALPGLERLGVGFVEVGTILTKPWAGNPDRPRLQRMKARKGIWNRLGFPSDGVAAIAPRLKRFPRAARRGLLVGCNIGPHPGHLKNCNSPQAYLELARTELLTLVDLLYQETDFFVINLSSPNTAGLRGMLSEPLLASQLVKPVHEQLLKRGASVKRIIPLLMKLPPDDPGKQPWTKATLSPVIKPLLNAHACDGFVAVNTSTRLAQDILQNKAGGVSGGPLLNLAADSIRLLRSLVGKSTLIIGCGGVTRPGDAVTLQRAGADLVELYSGMIYAGPTLPAGCARALKECRR